MQGIRPGWRSLRAKTSEEDVTEEDDNGKGSSGTDAECNEGSPPPFLNKAKEEKKEAETKLNLAARWLSTILRCMYTV